MAFENLKSIDRKKIVMYCEREYCIANEAIHDWEVAISSRGSVVSISFEARIQDGIVSIRFYQHSTLRQLSRPRHTWNSLGLCASVATNETARAMATTRLLLTCMIGFLIALVSSTIRSDQGLLWIVMSWSSSTTIPQTDKMIW
jgi:hypothetical protein